MKLLAEGKWFRNQIVKAGKNAYGIQCHFELTPGMHKTWIQEDPDLQKLDIEWLTEDFKAISRKYKETGLHIFRNFFRIAGLV
jgi:GMP synthase-like glutamine amidotransferase